MKKHNINSLIPFDDLVLEKRNIDSNVFVSIRTVLIPKFETLVNRFTTEFDFDFDTLFMLYKSIPLDTKERDRMENEYALELEIINRIRRISDIGFWTLLYIFNTKRIELVSFMDIEMLSQIFNFNNYSKLEIIINQIIENNKK